MRFTFELLLISILAHAQSLNFPRKQHSSGEHEECYPSAVPSYSHYIVGYGSLMQENSKRSSAPNAGESIPIRVSGYKRKWNTQGFRTDRLTKQKYQTTFLGVVRDRSCTLNAVVFSATPNDLDSYDRREQFYCRVAVPVPCIHVMAGGDVPTNAKIWIYVTKPELDLAPNKAYPIVTAYADIFLSGCLELENKFKLQGFGKECVKTTSGWSHEYWITNRGHNDIDNLLIESVQTYDQVTLQGLVVLPITQTTKKTNGSNPARDFEQ